VIELNNIKKAIYLTTLGLMYSLTTNGYTTLDASLKEKDKNNSNITTIVIKEANTGVPISNAKLDLIVDGKTESYITSKKGIAKFDAGYNSVILVHPTDSSINFFPLEIVVSKLEKNESISVYPKSYLKSGNLVNYSFKK
jgi:hypothetical protein